MVVKSNFEYVVKGRTLVLNSTFRGQVSGLLWGAGDKNPYDFVGTKCIWTLMTCFQVCKQDTHSTVSKSQMPRDSFHAAEEWLIIYFISIPQADTKEAKLHDTQSPPLFLKVMLCSFHSASQRALCNGAYGLVKRV